MKILVCISNVPDTTSKITFTDNNTTFNTSGVQFVINPYDEIALSKAVDLAANGAGTVTTITVADASADATIRKGLTIGADSAVRVDAQPKDAWFVANQIANYAKDQGFDLGLTGRESIDYNGAQVGVLLGELRQVPSVSVLIGLSRGHGQASVKRQIDGGVEVLLPSRPTVVGTAEGAAQPKLPKMRGIMSARTKPLEGFQV